MVSASAVISAAESEVITQEVAMYLPAYANQAHAKISAALDTLRLAEQQLQAAMSHAGMAGCQAAVDLLDDAMAIGIADAKDGAQAAANKLEEMSHAEAAE